MELIANKAISCNIEESPIIALDANNVVVYANEALTKKVGDVYIVGKPFTSISTLTKNDLNSSNTVLKNSLLEAFEITWDFFITDSGLKLLISK